MSGFREYEPVEWAAIPPVLKRRLVVTGRIALEIAAGFATPAEFGTIEAVVDVPGPGAYVGGSPDERYEAYLTEIGLSEADVTSSGGDQRLLVETTHEIPASVLVEDCRIENPDSAFERYSVAAPREFMPHRSDEEKRRIRSLLSTDGRARFERRYDLD